MAGIAAISIFSDNRSVNDSLDQPAVDSAAPAARLSELRTQIKAAARTCERGAISSDPTGEYALAEVDIAMADNIDQVSPEQEYRIRKSLGAEMGLAPGEVNGWREIYRGRAARARRMLQERESKLSRARAEMCATRDRLQRELQLIEEQPQSQSEPYG